MREDTSGVAMAEYEYILDEDGPPPDEELVPYRILQCQGCGTNVKVKRPHGEPYYEDGNGLCWPTFYDEPTAPESCKKCSPPDSDSTCSRR